MSSRMTLSSTINDDSKYYHPMGYVISFIQLIIFEMDEPTFMPEAPTYESTQLSNLYFLPPPINESFPKYSLHLQNHNEVTALSQSYMTFGEVTPLVPPPIPKGQLVTLKLKEEMRSLSKEIYKKMMKLVQNFKGYQMKEGTNNLSAIKICDQANRLFHHCKQVRAMEVKQQIAQIILMETAQIIHETQAIKKSMDEVKDELSKGLSSGEQMNQQGNNENEDEEICDYFNNE